MGVVHFKGNWEPSKIVEVAVLHRYRQAGHIALSCSGKQRVRIGNADVVLPDLHVETSTESMWIECKYNLVASYGRVTSHRWESSIYIPSWEEYRALSERSKSRVYIASVHEHEDLFTLNSYTELDSDPKKRDCRPSQTGSKSDADMRAKFFWAMEAFTPVGTFSELLEQVPKSVWVELRIDPASISEWIKYIRKTADPQHECADCARQMLETNVSTDHYYNFCKRHVVPAFQASVLWPKELCRQLLRRPTDADLRKQAYDELIRLSQDLNYFHPDGSVPISQQALNVSRMCRGAAHALEDGATDAVDRACVTIGWALSIQHDNENHW